MKPSDKHKRVQKLWGSEVWIVNEPRYCGKVLYLKEGFQSSLHWHLIKAETMFCAGGQVRIETKDMQLKGTRPLDQLNYINFDMFEPTRGDLETHVLSLHDSIDLAPRCVHRFQAIGGDAVLIEFSTYHEDSDVKRMEPSRKLDAETT